MGNAQQSFRGSALGTLAAVLLGSVAHGQTAVPPPAGLTSWWAFDGSARDLGPRGLDGSLVGTGAFPPARVLAGYQPAPGGCVTVADAPSLDVSRSFTYEGWLRVDALNATRSYVLHKGGTTQVGTPYSIGVIGSAGAFPVTPGASVTGTAAPGRMFVCFSDGSLEQAFFTDVAVTLGRFTHFAVTVTPMSNGTVQLNVYQDGVRTRLAFIGRLPFAGGSALQIGGIAGSSAETMNGVIDELTLYDRGLTQAEVVAILNAGAEGKIKPRTDVTPPAVTLDYPAHGSVLGNPLVTVRATVIDESITTVLSQPAGLSASLPAGGGVVSGDVLLPGPDGDVTVLVSATDVWQETASASAVVTLDTTAPAVNVAAPADGHIASSTPVSFAVEVGDLTATRVEIGAERRDLLAGGGAVTIPVALVAGTNDVRVVVTDVAGNRTEVVRRVVLDVDAPVVTVLSPADGTLFGAGGANAAVAVRVDDIGPTSVASQPAGVAGNLPAGGGVLTGTIALQEGLNTLVLTATDAGGREAGASVTVNLDTTPPSVDLASPSAGALVRGTIEVRGSATDVAPGSGVAQLELLLDGTRVALGQGDVTIALDTTTIQDGSHELAAVARDGAGNESRALATVVVDNTAPSVTIVTPLANASVHGLIAFEARGTDAGSGLVELRQRVAGLTPTVDGSRLVAEPVTELLALSQEDTLRWPNGALLLSVVAVDLAGNVTEQELEVMVGNDLPAAPALSPADGQLVRNRVKIVASTTRTDLQRLELLIDGALVAHSKTSPLRLTVDTRERMDGPMLVEARVVTPMGTSSTRHVLQVDNVRLAQIEPTLLDLDASTATRYAYADTTGPNLPLLAALARGRVELRVAGGAAVPLSGVVCVRVARGELGLRLLFDRQKLAASVRSSLAAAGLPPCGQKVVVSLWAGDAEIGAKPIRVQGKHRGCR